MCHQARFPVRVEVLNVVAAIVQHQSAANMAAVLTGHVCGTRLSLFSRRVNAVASPIVGMTASA
ncbi:hypothetical protein GCM10009554_61970 [Kribbella koreensis]|uniref:Uncharacterized protein n=1 Tax=Kribbella koreensis TaxID=57909 RepID=A0ABN1RD18_9ACTN